MATIATHFSSRTPTDGLVGRDHGSKRLGTRHSIKDDAVPLAISARTITVNAAFLREIKEDNEELRSQLAELHRRFQRPIELGECRPMIDRLYPLLEAVVLYFDLEETYGYFDNPLDEDPKFSDLASSVRNQHRELHSALIALIEWAERMFHSQRPRRQAWKLLQENLAQHFLEFERRLRRHELAETALICDAYARNVGVSG